MHSTRALLVSVHMDTITSYGQYAYYVVVCILWTGRNRVFLRCFCLVNNSGGNERAGTTSAIVPGETVEMQAFIRQRTRVAIVRITGHF